MLIKGSLTPGTFQAFFPVHEHVQRTDHRASYMTNPLQSALASMERYMSCWMSRRWKQSRKHRSESVMRWERWSFPRSLWPIIGESTFCFLYPLIFMMFQALDSRQKVMSHYLILQPLLYFFNCHLIYFCYFFPLLPISPAALRFHLSKVLSIILPHTDGQRRF